jgi:hypothetical protein
MKIQIICTPEELAQFRDGRTVVCLDVDTVSIVALTILHVEGFEK